VVNFPTSFDNNSSLYLVANNKRTRLTSSISSSDLTIPVVTTSGFPSTGFITILSTNTIVDSEAIKYTSTNATNFFATQRGAGGTTASPHFTGNNVDLNFVADHHNPLKDAIMQLEQFVGISGAENFLQMDDFGNVIVPRTLTVSGGSTFSFATVTGTTSGRRGNFTTALRSPAVSGTTVFSETSNVSGNTVMQGNLTVTGTATLGTLVVTGTATATGTSRFIGNMSVDNQITVGLPAWVGADFLTAYNDTTQTIPSSSYSPANVQTGPTVSGVEYLVVYQGHAGAAAVLPEKVPDLRLIYGNIELAQYQRRSLQTSTSPDPEGLAFAMHGFTVVTGTGDSFSMQCRATGSFISDTRINALAIIAWPLTGRFRRNIDYFYDVRNDSTFGSALPVTFGNPPNTLLSTSFDIPETGNYLFFAMAECNTPSGAATTNGSRFRFLVDGIYQRTEFVIQPSAFGATSLGENLGVMNVSRLSNLTKGSHTFAVEGASRVSTTSSFRRPRIFVIRENAVQQVQRATSSTFVSITNSGNYEPMNVSGTYTPHTNENVLVLSHAIPSISSVQVHPETQLINITRHEIYRTNAGTVGGVDFTSSNASAESHVMCHLLPMSSGVTNIVTVSGKTNPGGFVGTTTRWGYQPASGTSVPRELLMISTTPSFDHGFEWVTISGKTITTDTFLSETVTAVSNLTISGAAVATGTSLPLESLNSVRGIVTVTGIGSLHTTMSGQTITVSGEPPGSVPDPLNIGTLNASTSLTVSGFPVSTGTAHIPDPLNVGTLNASTSLTISGAAVRTSSSVPDPLNLGAVHASNSLTVSGVPVATGISVSSLNTLRNDLLVSGTGAVTILPTGQIITISGNPFSVASPVNIGILSVTGSLTISGAPVAVMTGTRLSTLNTLQNRVTVAGTGSASVTTLGNIILASGNPASIPDSLTLGSVSASNSMTISGIPVATGVGKAALICVLDGGNQTTNINAGSHIRWDGTRGFTAGRVFLDTASAGVDRGKFTLQPGSTYEIFADINVNFSGSSTLGESILAIRSETGDATGCVSQLRTFATTHSGLQSGNGTTMAVVTPAVPTKYEVRILSGRSVTGYITPSYCRIKEL
jgi:hypothetical protein